jgi:hypothetical protein
MKCANVVLAGLLLCFSVTAVEAAWDPAAYAEEDVLEFYTENDEGKGHWSKVWLVVADGDVYIRLGGRAGGRIDENPDKPYVKIRVGGEEFGKVRLDDAPDKVEQVAELMGEKYWSDVFIKYAAHPYTLKLTPEEN